jgi:uncharacterized membrane protein
MKYLKRGIATLIPLLLVIQVISFLTTFILDIYTGHFNHLDTSILLIGVVSLLLIIFFLGYASTHIKLFQRVKNYIDNKWIKKLPFIGTIYGFGNDVVSTFTNDVKDNEMIVVEVDMGGFKVLGVLTDKENSIGFIISAPSPLTGVVMKLPNYKILDISFIEAVKINSSLGRIGGDKW